MHLQTTVGIYFELMATPIKNTKQHTYESFPRIDEDCGDEDVVQTHDNFSSTVDSKSTDASFTLTSTFSVKGDNQFTWENHSTGKASKIMKKMGSDQFRILPTGYLLYFPSTQRC